MNNVLQEAVGGKTLLALGSRTRRASRARGRANPRAVGSVAFAVENLRNVLLEMSPLFRAHWLEAAMYKEHIPLELDTDKYLALSDAGVLFLVTIRDAGKLVGYYVAMLTKPIRYKTLLVGVTDVFYLMPEYRRGRNGIELFKYVERELKARGVKKIVVGTKAHLHNERIFEYLGFDKAEVYYTKYLGD